MSRCCQPIRVEFRLQSLGVQSGLADPCGLGGDFQKVSGGFEGGLSLKSNLLDRSAMWDQVLGRAGETASRGRPTNGSMRSRMNSSPSTCPFCPRPLRVAWGIGALPMRTAGGVCEHHLSSETAKLFTDGGTGFVLGNELVETGRWCRWTTTISNSEICGRV